MSVVSQHGAGEDVKKPAPQDTQTRSRLLIGQNGPSDSALAASSGGRLLAAQPLTGTLRAALLGACARACVPRRYTPSIESQQHPAPQLFPAQVLSEVGGFDQAAQFLESPEQLVPMTGRGQLAHDQRGAHLAALDRGYQIENAQL